MSWEGRDRWAPCDSDVTGEDLRRGSRGRQEVIDRGGREREKTTKRKQKSKQSVYKGEKGVGFEGSPRMIMGKKDGNRGN